MDSYVGLDVSLREVSVCVVDEVGVIQCERTVAADPDVIAAFLNAQAPTVRRVGLESGPTSVWLWRELAERGIPVIWLDLVDSRDEHSLVSLQSDSRLSRS